MTNEINPSPAENLLEPLTIDRVLDLWTKTYNLQGKPDWSHLFPYYHDEIVFQDSIQRIEGKEAFMAMCGRLTGRCEELNMEILSIAQDGSTIIFDWIMTMAFRRFPSTPLYGCTKLTVGENHQIIQQRDYFDIWGDIFNGIPYFKKMYRRFMHRYFG
jgi:limonene-1,2-epoxide hydrolase